MGRVGWELARAVRRKAYAKRATHRRQENERRLREVRRHIGRVPLRFMLQVLIPTPGKRQPFTAHVWGSLLGETLQIDLSEPVDAWVFWGDVKRFIQGWRPARTRSDSQQVRASALLDEWERLGR